MILYIHCRVLPLNTFVVNAQANWSVLRVRGLLLHKLAEIGHHRHPFRLRYKGEFLRDSLTLLEAKIFESVSIELVPLATSAELQADLLWRYVPSQKRDEPHLAALRKERRIFERRSTSLSWLRVITLSLLPLSVFDFFLPSTLWIWGLAQAFYALSTLHFMPGFSYQSGWVGKTKNPFPKSTRFDYFSVLAIVSFFTLAMNGLCLAVGIVNQPVSSMPIAYTYIVLGLSALIIAAITVQSIYLHLNSSLDYGELIEQSLTRFGSIDELRVALESETIAHRRAAAFELSTRVACGESEHFKEFLIPLNRAVLTPDDYTREHATEAIAEMLTLPELQEYYANECDVATFSSALMFPRARGEVLNGLLYLANGRHVGALGEALVDLVAVDVENLTESERDRLVEIFVRIVESGEINLDSQLVSALGQLLKHCTNEEHHQQVLKMLEIVAKQSPRYMAQRSVLSEVLSISTRTLDGQTIATSLTVIDESVSNSGVLETLIELAPVFQLFLRGNMADSATAPGVAKILSKMTSTHPSRLGDMITEFQLDVIVADFLDSGPTDLTAQANLFDASTKLELEKKKRVQSPPPASITQIDTPSLASVPLV